jgi:hypothetical protein
MSKLMLLVFCSALYLYCFSSWSNLIDHINLKGACGGTVDWGSVLQAGRLWFQFPMVSLEFFINIILQPHCVQGVDSPCNRNEYQEYFQWGKGGGCIGLTTLSPSFANCLEMGSSTSWSPLGLDRPDQGLLYLYINLKANFNWWNKSPANECC